MCNGRGVPITRTAVSGLPGRRRIPSSAAVLKSSRRRRAGRAGAWARANSPPGRIGPGGRTGSTDYRIGGQSLPNSGGPTSRSASPNAVTSPLPSTTQ